MLQSAKYVFEKADGRNYCLNSAVEHKFVDGYYRLESGGTTTGATQVSGWICPDDSSHTAMG